MDVLVELINPNGSEKLFPKRDSKKGLLPGMLSKVEK
jgi:hypothetical protein